MKKNIVNVILLIFTNIWIAYFSLKSMDSSAPFNIPIILIGSVILLFMVINELQIKIFKKRHFKDVLKKFEPDFQKKAHVYIYLITSLLSIALMVIPNIMHIQNILWFYVFAFILFIVGSILYNNKVYTTLLLQFLYNFICPTLGLTACFTFVILGQYGKLQIAPEYMETFESFANSFINVLVNVLGMSFIPLVLFILFAVLTTSKIADAFKAIRNARHKAA